MVKHGWFDLALRISACANSIVVGQTEKFKAPSCVAWITSQFL